MPNKRKCDNRSENIKRKIRKLESQLNQKSRQYNRLIIYSDSENEGSDDDRIESELTCSMSVEPVPLQTLSPTPGFLPTTALAPALVDMPSTSQTVEPPSSTVVQTDTDPDLDSEILTLLGEAPKSDIKFGKPTHKDLASRWQEILEKGLPKELKEKLIEAYLIPENCELLVAPSLNPEIKVALADTMVKRDSAMLAKQNQVSIAIAALNQAIELIIAKEHHHKILKPISDASRLLCDSHFTDTKTRRGFVISAINSEMKDALSETKRDKLLFGENISEKLKSAKTIKRSATDLTQTRSGMPPKKFNKNNFVKSNRYGNNRLNWKTMPRKITPKADLERSRQLQQPQRTNGGSQRWETWERPASTKINRRR